MLKYIRTSLHGLFSDSPPRFEVSSPYNFQHIQHAEADPNSSTGFVVSDMLLMIEVLYVINLFVFFLYVDAFYDESFIKFTICMFQNK